LIFFDILTGQVTTLAGSSEGFEDGIGSIAKMNFPTGMCFNPHDNCLYVSDTNNHRIRKVTMNGIFIITSLID
jgi:sugar lactone lactonase YvrE